MPTPYRVSLAEPDLNGREVYYVNQALVGRQLTQGEFVERFETEFAKYLGVKHAIACSSGTAALHLALLAAGVQPGDTVLVPTLTYVATVAAVRYCGAVPVFGDADPETWGLVHSAAIQGSPRPAAEIPVHLYGVATPATAARATHVIEDAAEALGGTAYQKPLGTLGDVGVFSFYGNKILTTGEGGMVVTDDAALAAEVRLLRGQGQSPERRYWHTRVGMNGRMTELSAAIGCAQLERLDEMLAVRTQRLKEYHQLLEGAVAWQTPRPGTVQAPWVAACLLPQNDLRGGAEYSYPYFRDVVMQDLAKAGIESRPVFPLVSDMPPYREYAHGQDFPVARDISNRGIVLPLHSQMSLDQVDDVCSTLRSLL